MTLKLDRIIDWYDGVVTGVITRQPSEEPWLITLLAWNPTKRKRAYGAVPVTATERAVLVSDTLDWTELLSEAKRIAFSKASAVLILVNEETNSVISERALSMDEFRTNASFDIAATMGPTTEHYLES